MSTYNDDLKAARKALGLPARPANRPGMDSLMRRHQLANRAQTDEQDDAPVDAFDRLERHLAKLRANAT